jgi:uncharacterized protein
MKLDISAIPEGGLQQDLKFEFLNEAYGKTFAVSASLKILKAGERILVEGTIVADAELVCSRCLGDFVYPLRIKFRDEVSPIADSPVERERELERAELDASFYREEELALDDLVREQVFLALPMKPLCREDCMGICPKCGRILADSLCSCRDDRTDPRLEPLKELQKKLIHRKE